MTGSDALGVEVLGIEVDREQLMRWREWLMPEEQPYLVPRPIADSLNFIADQDRLSFEVKDSFCLYDLDDHALCWLDRSSSRRLAVEVRREQPAPHRWPLADPDRDVERLIRFVEEGRRTSRHLEVEPQTWHHAAEVLPGARRITGTFPAGSGPNCFGAVMGAAGVAGVANRWIQRQPFEHWLASSTRPGGCDEDPGTVLVWRNVEGEVDHAAVTLSGGWALHKPSQGWMSPTKVLSVRDTKLSSRTPGRHLERRSLLI